MISETKCPICHGLEKKYRVGLDELYKTVPREEYDKIKPLYTEQLKNETLVIQAFSCVPEKSGNLKVTMFARCSNCKATWSLGEQVMPVIRE
ncbi:MAG: hypothetical protein ACNYVW_11000 [Methanosarcinales archaeon]